VFDLVRITGCRRRGLDLVRVSWRTTRGRPPLLAPPERTDRSGSRCSRARAGPSGGGAEQRRRAGSQARWSAPERGGALQGGRARWSRSGSRCSRPRAPPSGGGGLRRRGAGSGARWSAGGRPSEVERWRLAERGGAPRQCGAGGVSATHCAPAMRARA
jgi:hypothetical protein